MVGSEYDNCAFIQPQFFQFFQYTPEFPVYSGYRCKIIGDTFIFRHIEIYIRTYQQAIQRFVFIKIVIFLHAIVQGMIRTVWWVETYYHKKRFIFIPDIPFITQISDRLIGFMFGRPLIYIVALSFRVPVMRVLMYVECPIRIPVIEPMSAFWRSISIPGGTGFSYVFPRIIRVVRGRVVQMQLTDISTIITGFAEYITDAFSIYR